MSIFNLMSASDSIPPLNVRDVDLNKSVKIKVSKELTKRGEQGYPGYSVTATTSNGDRELFLFKEDLPKFPIKPGESGEAVVTRRSANSDLCKIKFAANLRAIRAAK